jgi:hypothetical protein
LAHAGDNEIRATKETKEAVARITTYLNKLWAHYRQEATGIVLFGELLEQLLDESCKLVFVQKILRKSSQGDEFEVATTPSHRSTGTQQSTSAMVHFISRLAGELEELHFSAETNQSQDDKACALYETIERLTYKVCTREPTLLKKVKYMSDSVRSLIQKKRANGAHNKYTYCDQFCHHGLVVIEDLLVKPGSYGLDATDGLEQGYQHLTSMMSDIACYTAGLSSRLSACYRAVMNKALAELGPGGALVFVTEASARNIHHFLRNRDTLPHPCRDSTLLVFAEMIVDTAPISVPSADIRKVLERFGTGHNQSPARKADLYEIYHMSNYLLAFAYEHLPDNAEMVGALASFVSTMSKVLGTQNSIALAHARVMQGGIATVVMDKKARLFIGKSSPSCTNLVSGSISTECLLD